MTSLIVGSVDTRMAAHVEGPKEDPRDIARAGLRAMCRGERVATPTAWPWRRGPDMARDPARYERGLAQAAPRRQLRAG